MTELESRGRAAGVYWTADELMSVKFPEPRWAVPGLVAEGLNLLVGSPKLGKSWLVLGLGVAVASGGVALGKIPVEQGKVLYAALEDPGRRLQQRLRKVLGDEPAPADLHIVTSLPRGGEMLDLVGEWLQTHPDARLVIVDVLRKVTPRSDGRNLYEQDYESLGALKTLADRHQVAVIAVHHTRKSVDENDVVNEVSGSTGLTGAADAILIAKRARNTASAVLHVTGRDITEQDHGLSWQSDTCTWSLLEEPVVLATMGSSRRKVLDHVAANEGVTPQQVADALGINAATVRQTMRRMVEDDQLATDGEGRYFLPMSLSHLSPVSLTQPDSDSSDRCDSHSPALRVINNEGDH